MNTDFTQMKMPAGDGHPAAGNTDALNVADCRSADKPHFTPAEPLELYSRVVRRTPAEADVVERFRQAIEAAGLTPPEFILADGQRHRFSSNGRRGDDAGWYFLHLDGVAAGAFGCWRLGISQKWSSKSEGAMTVAEHAASHPATSSPSNTICGYRWSSPAMRASCYRLINARCGWFHALKA